MLDIDASVFRVVALLFRARCYLCCQQTLKSVSCCCSKSLIWGSLAAFCVISSLFSPLASLCALLSSLSSRLSSLIPLCSLPSSLFSLSALFPLLSLLLISQIARTCPFELCIRPSTRCCSFLRSHLALVTSNFASGHRIRSQLPRLFAAPSLARRNARSDEIIINNNN